MLTGMNAAVDKDDVDSGLTDFLSNYRPRTVTHPPVVDDLQDRFKILVQQPLPELGNEMAKAYAAVDNLNDSRQIYALVLDSSWPYRLKLAEVFSTFNHPHIQAVLGSGTVQLSSTNKSHQVVVLDRPTGSKLSTIKESGQRMHEHQVIDKLLLPLSRALVQYREKGMVHGSLNLDTVMMGEETFVLESCSSPCGHYQHYLYEPLERLMADQLARGIIDERCDVYAVAVIAFEMIYGLDHLRKLNRDDYIQHALEIGTYHLFSQNLDLSDNMADFFRGAMSDNLEERWDIDHFLHWLSGKRYNMIVPPTPRDATRAIQFMGADYFSRRSLAHAFHRNWRTTMKELRELRLDRWFEMSMHRPDLADRVDRILRLGGSGSSEKTNIDMLTRLISLLDPIGPIRTPNLSIRPEGIGMMLANLFRQNLPSETQELVDLIEADVPNYWGYLTEGGKSQELSQVLWKVQRVRPYLKIRGPGFGLERLLYEFNVNLACQSEMLKSFNVLTMQEALRALDTLAPSMAKTTSLLDRHIAAFLASKLDIGKEIKLQDVAAVPALSDNVELVAMRILARAQQKNEKERLVGLSTWVAIRIEALLEHIHNRTLRKRLKSKLKSAASSGDINEVLSILVNRDVIHADSEGFQKALSQHQMNNKAIQELRDTKRMQRLSLLLGSRLSSVVGYIILIASFYYIAAHLSG